MARLPSSSYLILSLLILESLTMIFPLGLAQLIPPGAESPASFVNQRPEKKFNVMECVIAMSNVFVCTPDVYRYIVAGRNMNYFIRISQPCCVALFEIGEKCCSSPFPQNITSLCAEPEATPTPPRNKGGP